ncbi:MAG: PRD domain-containing protein [Bifidobacteriaceae bacterium]|jgi:beta-glucoside operon transcriptional antiterminator|nr:PRD domain-containing protein [Bifidobacteriaceae bacterium]
MRVVKVFNNNTVLVSDDGTLAVISGNGVGFAHRKGDELKFKPTYLKFVFDSGIKNATEREKESQIGQTFRCSKSISDNDNGAIAGDCNIEEFSTPTGTIQRYLDLLLEIPDEIFDLCAQIIGYAKIKLPRSFSDSVFFTLADHLNFAIGRIAMGINFQNALTLEIRVFYPEEYDVGEMAVGFIKDKLSIEFGDDEKSFIAMHFVNAELGEDLPQTIEITKVISDISAIVGAKYDYRFDKNTLSYFRFVTHIKFFAQRIFRNEQVIDQPDDILYGIVKNGFPQYFEGALAIQEYIENKYRKEVTNQELAYLTVHLKRIIDATESEPNQKKSTNCSQLRVNN